MDGGPDAVQVADVVAVAEDIDEAAQFAVVGEEAVSEGHVPELTNAFFLVDPLDGTKDFIARNGEFRHLYFRKCR